MSINLLSYIAIIFFNIFLFKKFGGSFFNFIPSILILFIIFSTSIINYFKKNNTLFFNFNLIIVFIWLFLMILSLLWTNSFFYGSEKIITFLLTILTFYFLSPILYKHFKFFLFISALTYILYILNLYFSYGGINELSSLLRQNFRLGWDEDESTLFHPIGIARFISFSFLNIYFAYLIFKNKFNTISIFFLISALISIGLVYLFFSGTKTPLVGIIIATIAYLVLNKYTKLSVKFLIISFPFFLVLILKIFITYDLGLTENQKTYIEYRFFDSNAAFSDRALQNERALSKISATNLLFGTGSGNFSYLYNKKDTRDYPHNIFSEMLIENGIITLFILLYMLYLVIKVNISNKNNLPLKYFIITFYFFYFNSLFSGDLISNNLMYGFFITIIMENKLKGQY